MAHGISGSWFYHDMESPVSLWLHLYGKKQCRKVVTARRKQEGDLAGEILFQILLCTPGWLKSIRFLSPGVFPCKKKRLFSPQRIPHLTGRTDTSYRTTEESRGRKFPPLRAWGAVWLVALFSSRKSSSPFDAGVQSVAKKLKSLCSSWATEVG